MEHTLQPKQQPQSAPLTIVSAKVQINDHHHQLVQPFSKQQHLLPSTSAIKIQGNSYSKDFCFWFSQQLKTAKQLKDLNINDVFVARTKEEIPASIQSISKGLIGSQLKRLDISNNAVNPFGAKALLIYLEQAVSLEVLLICNCGLGPLGVAEIAKGLKGTPQLKSFAIARNRMEDPGILSIADSIQHVPKLEQLFIYQNTLKKQGLSKLFKELREHCKSLTSFDLCDNFVREEATVQMGKLITETIGLKNLNLSDCLNEDENEEIITAFENSKNRQFERLGFNYIELTSELAIRLIQVVKQCEKMIRLDIVGNQFSKKIQKKFTEALGEKNILSKFQDEDEEDEMVRLFEEMKI